MKTPSSFQLKLIAAYSAIASLQSLCAGQQPPGPLNAGPERPNLLTNSFFEKGMANWELSPKSAQVTATPDPDQPHNGHASMRIDNVEVPNATHIAQAVTLKPATRYRLSGWIKATKIVKGEGERGGEAGAGLAILGGYETTNWVSDTKDWIRVSMDFTTKTKTDLQVGPWLGHYGKRVTGTAWFADLSLIELGPENKLAGAPSASAPPAASNPAAKPSDGPDDEGRFMGEMRELLYASKFDELSAIVTEADKKHSRFPDGAWKLSAFFEGIGYPRNQNSTEDWKALAQLLETWDKKARTVYTINAMAEAQLNFAWHIRTHDFASSVTEEQWQIFSAAVEKSLNTLKQALPIKHQCVDVYRNLLHIGISQGWPREKMESVLNESIALAPDYYESYYNMAFYLMERWYGKEGDWQTFLNSLPERIPGEAAYDVYTRVALKLHPYYKENFFGQDKSKSVDWPTMKRGFEVIRKTCPDSSWDLNIFAFYAVLAKDTPTSMALVRELVDQHLVRISVWGSAKYFDEVKTWAFHER